MLIVKFTVWKYPPLVADFNKAELFVRSACLICMYSDDAKNCDPISVIPVAVISFNL